MTLAPKSIPSRWKKSDYEKDLERQLSNATDDDQRARIQRDLDRERARRERQQRANDRNADIASQMKSEQVAQNRMMGGSRFNLRWDKSIPADQLNPQAITKLLSDYVDFNTSAAVTPAAQYQEIPSDALPA